MKFLQSNRNRFMIGLIIVGAIITGLVLMNGNSGSNTQNTATNSTPESDVPAKISAVYMRIINTGIAPQTLVSASAEGIDLVSVYRNPSMETDERGLTLNPHQQVTFTSETEFLLLYGAQDDLEVGDMVNMTLRFDSGDEINVDIPVRFEEAQDTNVQVVDDFQLINAYAVPTAFGSLDDNTFASNFNWNLPAGFPLPIVPSDNPMTEEKFQLGRYLFYDARLSGNGEQSCSSCHLQELAFTDGLTLAVGSTGEMHPRNSQSLVNVAYNPSLTWGNPTLTTIERQVLIPMFGEFPIELGMTGNEEDILSRFREDERYQDLFTQAFPDADDPFTFGNIQYAVSTFVRAIISANSPYDQFVFSDDKTALTASQIRGMDLFFGERFECHHCHGGFNFTDSTVHGASVFIEMPFHNTGLYNIDGEGGFPPQNQGVYEITGDPDDMGSFRAPSLRNIELTAPYMHDGSIATLDEVIRFYADGGRVIEDGEYAGDGRNNPHKSGFVAGFTISEQEITDLINFLESLTDESLITNERFSDPFAEE